MTVEPRTLRKEPSMKSPLPSSMASQLARRHSGENARSWSGRRPEIGGPFHRSVALFAGASFAWCSSHRRHVLDDRGPTAAAFERDERVRLYRPIDVPGGVPTASCEDGGRGN